LNDQHHPAKGSDKGTPPSNSSLTGTPSPGEEQGPRPAEAVTPLQDQPSLLETALAMEAAGIAVIPLRADGTPAIENWQEYLHRRATPEEIRSWFGPESHGAP
jgi:hypothetical protein